MKRTADPVVLVMLLLVSAAWPSSSRADEGARPLTHPEGPSELQARVGLGLSIDVAPSRIVEGGPRRIPTIAIDGRLGLPARFSLLAQVRTQIVTTALLLGPAWSFDLGRVGVMLGYLAVPSFGWLGDFGFDTLTWSVSNQPIARVGLRFERVRVTLELGAEILFGRWARVGGFVVAQTDPVQYVGAHAMLTVENALRNGDILVYRIGLVSREGYAVLWPAFSDETSRLFFPRIEVAYAF